MRLRDLLFLVLASSLPLSGCSIVIGSATSRMADSLTAAVLDQNDPELVRDGAPSYLIAVDGVIEGNPDSESMLLAGAQLYSSYASAFVENPKRVRLMTTRALGYGERAMCLRNEKVCRAAKGPFDDFVVVLANETGPKDVPALYGYGSAWASWVQANSGDWNAVADLPKVQALMERVVALEDAYEEGGAHLYLGVLYTLRPASLGGKPEEGRRHFELAIEQSGRRNLMAQVLFAEKYARLVFDRELHDALLNEVLEADPEAKGYTLTNTLAVEQAQELLADADDYF